jgi:hypothetical protein
MEQDEHGFRTTKAQGRNLEPEILATASNIRGRVLDRGGQADYDRKIQRQKIGAWGIGLSALP